MRRHRQEQQRPGMFRGAELPRLMTGVVMLLVLYMLIVRAREPDTWRWLAEDDQPSANAAHSDAPKPSPPPPEPEPTGPTDLDPDQKASAEEEFQAVVDGSLTLQPEEMEPYDRLVFWAKNQSFQQMLKRARSDLLFTHFHDEPDKHRGQLATLDLNVRRILDAGKNRDGVQLYEVWGYSRESRDRLYVVIVVDLPKGMPIGPSVYEKARFVGYFFKLQGYHSSGAKVDAVPDRAPLLIGRLQWEQVVAPKTDNTSEWIWGGALLAILAAAFLLRYVYYRFFRRKPSIRTITSDATTGEVIPVEQWLDRAAFGLEDGNNSMEDDDLQNDGRDADEPHQRGGRHSPGGLDD